LANLVLRDILARIFGEESSYASEEIPAFYETGRVITAFTAALYLSLF
jgi:hypothetical protein